MAADDFTKWDDNGLSDYYRGLIRAYDDACLSYDREKAARVHRELYVIKDELGRRPTFCRQPRELEDHPTDAVVARFIEVAQKRAACDDPDETDRLYWVLDRVKDELQRRPGDARRELFKLYTHPDLDVRAAAAEATRNLVLQLSQHRLRHIDEDDWLPPADGLDIERAGLEEIFPVRSDKENRLKSHSGEGLRDRFVALVLEDDEADLEFNVVRRNQLYGLIEAVREEFRLRPLSERRLLIDLYTHPNPHLRLEAAKATADLEPDKARRVIDGTNMNEENKKPWRLLRKVIASTRASRSS